MNRRLPPTPEEPAARGEHRDRNRKKPDVGGAIRLLLVALVIGQGLRIAFASPRLRLREVRVSGTQRLTAAQVRELGRVPLDENIFRVNLVRVSENLKRDPVVRRAVVTRELPHTLGIDLEERTPAIQVAHEGRLFHSDREGVVFQSAIQPADGMPLLELPSKERPEVGRSLPAGLADTVWRCAELARDESLEVRNIRIDEGGELWLNIRTYGAAPSSRGNLAVRVGRATELPEKFRDIHQSVRSWPDLTTTAQYLNVMCAGRPAYLRVSERTDTGPSPAGRQGAD